MGGSPNVSRLKFGTSTRMLLEQDHQSDGDFNNTGICGNSSTDTDDSSKTGKNVPLTESYENFHENLDYDSDGYGPSVSDDVTSKPPSPKKNKLDNAP